MQKHIVYSFFCRDNRANALDDFLTIPSEPTTPTRSLPRTAGIKPSHE